MGKPKKVRVALVGCGGISEIYLENLRHRFSIVEVAGCYDRNGEAAHRVAAAQGIPVLTMAEILADESIELVLNLTTPGAHYAVTKEALLGGKHVYTEKPLAVSLNEAVELVELARAKGLSLGAAPDTFLGAAAQTACFAVDSGLIGSVTSCVALLNRDGGWMAEKYPFTALPGGGIGMDVGIYYVTLLLALLGPVTEVCGFWETLTPERRHYSLSREDFGEYYRLMSENLICASLRFQSGVLGSLHLNANSTQNEQPLIILYGTQGLLMLPNANEFGGEVRVLLKGQQEAFTLPYTHAYSDNCRGLGLADMAWGLRQKRDPRAGKELALHGLEVLLGICESAGNRQVYQLRSNCRRPAPLPRGYLGKDYSNANPENGLAVDVRIVENNPR